MCREGSSAHQQRGHKVGGEKSWVIARATLTPSSSTARIQHLRREAGTTAPRQHVRLSSVSRFVKWRLLLSWRGQCATRWRWMCWQRLSTLNLEARHNATARQRCLDAVGGSDGRSCCWATGLDSRPTAASAPVLRQATASGVGSLARVTWATVEFGAVRI